MIRYFCVVAPGANGNVGYAFLSALDAACLKIRAIPIGGAAALGIEQRWWRAGGLFTTPLELPYINVVCAPMGLTLGMRMSVERFATKEGLRDLPDELRKALGRSADRAADKAKHDPVVYEPKSALAGLYTVGYRNVAIVDLCNLEIDPQADATELAALRKYDLVICPNEFSEAQFAAAGIPARLMPVMIGEDGTLYGLSASSRLDLVLALARCTSGTGPTTEGSLAMVERPVITSSPSTTKTSSSKSSRSAAAPSKVPSTDTGRSIRSSEPKTASWGRRTWSSFTRLLGFSKRSPRPD